MQCVAPDSTPIPSKKILAAFLVNVPPDSFIDAGPLALAFLFSGFTKQKIL